MSKLYIAGPMRGYPEFNFPAFHAAEARLHQHRCFNPARWDEEVHGFDASGMTGHEDLDLHNFDLAEALSHDIDYVLREADGVAVLPGWERSGGARAEVAAALAIGKPVLPVPCWEDGLEDKPCTTHRITDVPPRTPAAAALDARPGRDTLTDGGEVRVTSATGGEKGMKLAQLGALDPDALTVVARVAGFGATKYSRYNFLRGYAWSLSFDAMMRHLLAFWNGEDDDAESGLPHLGHAAWHALALLAFTRRGLGTDDRYKGEVAS